MKLNPGATTTPTKGKRFGAGVISRIANGVPQQINGGSGLNVKAFGNRVVVSKKPGRTAAVGGGNSGVTYLGALDYFPAIPAADGSYEFLYTTENNGYKAYGGQTFWTALQKLTTSTGTPTA